MSKQHKIIKHSSIKEFPLAWRWIESNQYPLPENILTKLHPINSNIAKELNEELVAYQKNLKQNKNILNFNNAKDEEPDSTKAFLNSLEISNQSKIILSWDEETAISTVWEIFKNNWNAFCYPSSDDVFIIPYEGSWILQYFHYEKFEYEETEHRFNFLKILDGS